MEQNFQTSFIPKKPMIEKRSTSSSSVGLLTILSFFIFFTMLLATGGLYFYKAILTKNVTSMETDLNTAKDRFEPATISRLKILDRRLAASTEILNNHVSVSPIFQALSKITLKTVRYTNFSYSVSDEKKAQVKIQMNGQAVGYRSIALQSDLFAKNKNLINPVFSNLTLDDKGNVLFELNFSVDLSFINYKQVLKSGASVGMQ